jgi:hypothetical protein
MKLSVTGGKPKDVYVSMHKITKVEIEYDSQSEFNPEIVNDIALKVYYDAGFDEPSTLYINGNLKKDEMTGEVIGWGSAFKIKDFFFVCGVKGDLTDDNKIPEEWLDKVIGSEVAILRYVKSEEDGKYKFNKWDIIGRNVEALEAKFRKEYMEKGYPKAYSPELLEEQFPYGNNEPEKVKDIF